MDWIATENRKNSEGAETAEDIRGRESCIRIHPPIFRLSLLPSALSAPSEFRFSPPYHRAQ
jgi:hypothetical protein